jgi:hypothetical protein
MPARTSEVNPPAGNELVSIATFLPVRRWVDVVPFLRLSSKVSGQLMKSDVVRFGVKTDLLRKRFWTISVWSDRVAMRRFVATEPHATAVKKFAKWAGADAAFAEWTDAEGSIDWDLAKEKMKNPSFYYSRKETRAR